MTGSPPFCPNCGAQQKRTDARFCQACGRPLPVRPATPAPLSQPSTPLPRRRKLLWLLPLIALLLALAVVLAPPTRSALLTLVTRPTIVLVTEEPPGREVATPTSAAVDSATSASAATQAVTESPPATVGPDVTATPPPTTPSASTATPALTATRVPTSTPITPPTPPQVTVRQQVNLRAGPSQDFDVVRLLQTGERLTLQARTQQSDWLQVTANDGATGWAFAQYLDLDGAIVATLPVAVAPTLPTCSVAMDDRLRSAYTRSALGCPVSGARITWAAWQPFERGAMLWRDDTNQVTVFYQNGGWSTLPDQWDQVSQAPSRGAPPASRQAPIRGFGWIWGTRDAVFNGLGWATDGEKGVCLLVQDLERGYVFVKSNVPTCTDRQGNPQSNRAAELPPLFIGASGNGASWRSY